MNQPFDPKAKTEGRGRTSVRAVKRGKPGNPIQADSLEQLISEIKLSHSTLCTLFHRQRLSDKRALWEENQIWIWKFSQEFEMGVHVRSPVRVNEHFVCGGGLVPLHVCMHEQGRKCACECVTNASASVRTEASAFSCQTLDSLLAFTSSDQPWRKPGIRTRPLQQSHCSVSVLSLRWHTELWELQPTWAMTFKGFSSYFCWGSTQTAFFLFFCSEW